MDPSDPCLPEGAVLVGENVEPFQDVSAISAADVVENILDASAQSLGPMDQGDEDNELSSDEELDEDECEDPAVAGFRFCAEEAIRFLIEEEHYVANDPFVLELERHLEAQKRRLELRCQQQQQQQQPTVVQPGPVARNSSEGGNHGTVGEQVSTSSTTNTHPSLSEQNSETDQGFADMSSDQGMSP